MPRVLAEDEIELHDQPIYASIAERRSRNGEDRASNETVVPATAGTSVAPPRPAPRARMQPPPSAAGRPKGRSPKRCLLQTATFAMYGVCCFLLGVHFSGQVTTSLKSTQTAPGLGGVELPCPAPANVTSKCFDLTKKLAFDLEVECQEGTYNMNQEIPNVMPPSNCSCTPPALTDMAHPVLAIIKAALTEMEILPRYPDVTEYVARSEKEHMYRPDLVYSILSGRRDFDNKQLPACWVHLTDLDKRALYLRSVELFGAEYFQKFHKNLVSTEPAIMGLVDHLQSQAAVYHIVRSQVFSQEGGPLLPLKSQLEEAYPYIELGSFPQKIPRSKCKHMVRGIRLVPREE